ncbi:thioredoxin family protein [Niveispirillum irakense]|uniref:thioredoxin family protein n=1 Tax=Niveispirillum irakense TaxID=34011 RepID=UPI0003FA9D19|nr:thioredoxin family protein [Niveispirillum irakense]
MSQHPTRREFLQRSGLSLAGGFALAAGGGGLIGGLLAMPALAAAGTVGQAAPAFTGTDIDGKPVSLADYKGKLVILEWTNHGCPFVRKHYDSDNMQALQRQYTGQDVAWLTIISSAPGEQGHVTPEEAKARIGSEKWAATKVILDPAGEIGRAYDAKVTPHMYIIGKDGTLLYNGAIDDKPTSKQEDIKGATNYVQAAMADIQAGRAVQVATSRPYGCNVKYSKTTT